MNQKDYFTEKIATLPEDLQNAIRASNHESILRDIQREYKLHIDQAQILETLAIQLIFGDITAPQFVNNMFNEAHVSSSVAGDILLKIDIMILKKIRAYMEEIEEAKKRDEEIRKMMMSEEEQLEEDEANIYAAYYADVANIKQDVEKELLDEGVLPDGSNITDEMLAKELGISMEEFKKITQVGGIQEAREQDTDLSKTPILDEKAELLHELESPEKSFVKPLFTPNISTQNTTSQVKKEISISSEPKEQVIEKITLPDHQLQNTTIEKPYIENIEKPTEKTAQVSTSATITPVTPKETTPQNEPIIKKPTKLVLPSIDPYKEPIE